jgi:predicted DNA-binding transcriptional regulator YafY
LGQNSFEERFYKILSEIQRSFSKESVDLYKKIKQENLTIDVDNFYNREIIANCEKYCIESQKLKVSYMSRTRRETEIFYVEPKGVFYEENTVYFMVYNPKTLQNQKLIIDNILRIEQLPQKSINFSLLNNIVFELKAPLSKSYRIKSGEKIINYGDDSITVVNTSEDKDILLNRLLRYGQNCKIIQPQPLKREFCSLLEIISSNLKTETSELLKKYEIEAI